MIVVRGGLQLADPAFLRQGLVLRMIGLGGAVKGSAVLKSFAGSALGRDACEMFNNLRLNNERKN